MHLDLRQLRQDTRTHRVGQRLHDAHKLGLGCCVVVERSLAPLLPQLPELVLQLAQVGRQSRRRRVGLARFRPLVEQAGLRELRLDGGDVVVNRCDRNVRVDSFAQRAAGLLERLAQRSAVSISCLS